MTTALMTPGESAWPGVPVTQEGLQFAADQLSRLLFVLFAVAWLLTRWPAPVFAGAICNLASRSGVDAARRAATRLALTLQVIGAADRARPLWREVLAETSMPPTAMQEAPAIAFEDMPLGAWNRLVLTLALAATTGLWWVLP
jgi:hypothetical protein